MRTENQKSKTDAYTNKKASNTTLKIVLKPQENKRGREEKRPTKTNPKQ